MKAESAHLPIGSRSSGRAGDQRVAQEAGEGSELAGEGTRSVDKRARDWSSRETPDGGAEPAPGAPWHGAHWIRPSTRSSR